MSDAPLVISFPRRRRYLFDTLSLLYLITHPICFLFGALSYQPLSRLKPCPVFATSSYPVLFLSLPLTLSLCTHKPLPPQFYTKLTDLWANTEQIWEGVFSLIACIIIYLMGIAFLKMDRSRVKWRLKLATAFEKSQHQAVVHSTGEDGVITGEDKKEARSGKWALFLLPFVTVLREGLEAVVFVGGVSVL
jgi:hypothetical protein